MIDLVVALKEAEELVAALKAQQEQPDHTERRLGMLRKVDRIRFALEEPYDTMGHHFEVASTYSSAHVLMKLGAFEKMAAASAVTAQELAAACNIDESVISRPMRILVSNGIVSEPEPGKYAHTPLSMAYLPQALGGLATICAYVTRGQLAIPDYLKVHKPEDLFDLKKSLHAFIRGQEGKTYYELISEDPVERDLWNRTLQMMEQGMPILNMFPLPTLKDQAEKSPDRPFFVDVGGGRGQALLALQGECGGSWGVKWVLQDLPDVLATVKNEELPGVEKMVYDIFSGPQPVKDAHVYFMRRLLHDFYIPECIQILKNTASAMGTDSRLIICDMIVPEKVEPWGPQELYWLDWSLLCLGGREKTKREFIDMFDEVGLELVNIYPSNVGATAMLETRLKRQ